MHVSEIMNANLSTTTPDAGLPEVARALATHPHRLLYVVDADGRLQGVISSIDVLQLLAPFYLDANLSRSLPMGLDIHKESCAEHIDRTAGEIMRESVIALAGDDHLLHAEALIRQKGLNGLPVVDEAGVLVGEVTRTEILSLFSQALTEMESTMRRGEG